MMGFKCSPETSILVYELVRPPPCTKGFRAHHEESETKPTNSIWGTSEALSVSPLLNLPFELRQRIFEYVFMSAASAMFPPQRPSAPTRLLGLIQGGRYKMPGRGLSKNNVQALFLCRQLHQETRLMPLQVNLVNCPVVLGSNTSATKHFLEGLEPFQRRAIRKLELHLLASVTESRSLRSILRTVAGVAETDAHQEFIENSCGGNDEIRWDRKRKAENEVEENSYSSVSSELRELTMRISIRDLLLAQADSLVGLLHVLTVPASPQTSGRPAAPFACTASWVTEGLAYLRSLRRLSIVIEASVSVANQLIADEKPRFPEFVKTVLPWVDIDVQWLIQKDKILSVDENQWVSFL